MKGGAAAIVIGDEILSGKIRDSNGPLLVDVLRSVGAPLKRILTVSDDLEEIGWAVRSCLGRFQPIFTSGGIGPTHDDVTVAGVAAALGRKVVRHPELEALVRKHFGDALPEEGLRLANVPEGAILVRSPRSWYPVISVDEIYLLPGVPELFRMHVEGIAERYRGNPFHLRCVYVSEGEPAIAKILDRIAREHPDIALGSYPRIDDADHRVKLTLEAQVAEPVERALVALLRELPPGSVIRVE
ncbi:competence/damage-inducible protein A [Vulgatibacter incomptus]|uniref:Molybdopterin binding motif protein n=1 Tax=Vulgatibacter incomptus TaxID=1391653 RepID=A0A0K1PAH3_9BACT|nr:competence/damage-inducible protein A [Vulgatibacter incomptus]AKU90502.1 Molybdopterin binding motif protein [Vulgatibacter incomptus]